MIIINCKCGDVRKFKSEAAFLRATPDSIHYCRKCGAPWMPSDELTADEAAEVRAMLVEPTAERIAEVEAHNARWLANLTGNASPAKVAKVAPADPIVKVAPVKATQMRMF